jgi:hypothetical protein
MAVTQNTYTGNGSTTNYSITFEYLEETDIKVTLNGTLTTAYTFANATTISFTTAPAAGVAIRIYRDTDVDALQSTFFAGSAIRAQDLNDNFTQSNYSVQEIKDRFLDRTGGTLTGALDAGGFKITNVGTPTNNADASTKAYVDSTIGTAGGYAAAAASSASAAATSASNASTSATNSATSASASATSAAASLASETAAAVSQSAAASSASTASTQASNAATSASNASTSATNASNSATSAASSAASALAAFDSFDDRYLGAKASDPSVDNDGDPLNAGDLYYNTTSSVMKVYTGSAWVIAYVPGDAASISFAPYSTIASNNVQGAIQELTDEKLNLTGGTLTGNVTLDNQSDLRFGEATGHGGNWVAFQAPTTIASNVTWTLPSTDATVSGHALKSNAAGELSWGTAGGASGAGGDDVFYENGQTVTTSYTLTAGKNAMSAGPITINAGAVITVPSNASWVVL